MMQKKNSGLDIDLGDHCSRIAYGWAKKTFANRSGKAGAPCMQIDGAFSNVMDFHGVHIGISSDGIGTKVEIAERTGIYDTLGYDLIAMVVDDLVANGIEPVNVSNILDVDFLDARIVDQLMRGLHDAANYAGVAVTGGEIAELGSRVSGYGERMHFNWCATAIGILPADRSIIDGALVQPDDVIIALNSRGFRSNGFSLVRKVLSEKFGADWHRQKYDEEKSWGEMVLTPSWIYAPLIVGLLSQHFDIRGIAHITGGGIADNFGRVLERNNLGALLDHLFPPNEMMITLQEFGNLDEETVYRLWNMGNGMLLVVPPQQVNDILKFIADQNYRAQIAGHIIEQPEIIIDSAGCDPRVLVTREE